MMNRDLDCGIELAKRLDGNVESGDDTTTLRQEDAVDAPAPVDCSRRRDVTGADVFGQGTADQVAVVVCSERFER